MIKKSLSNKGFTTFEVVLVLLFFGLIGIIGWQVTKEKASTSRVAYVNTQTRAKSNTGATFNIPELGIKIVNLPISVADLTTSKTMTLKGGSTNNNATATYVYLSTKSLYQADPGCGLSNGAIASLTKTPGTDTNSRSSADTSLVKQFAGFYISYSHPQGVCSTQPQVANLQQLQIDKIKVVLTTPQNIQAL